MACILLLGYSSWILNRFSEARRLLISVRRDVLLLVLQLHRFILNSILLFVVLHELLKFFAFVLEEPGRVVRPIVVVSPFLVHVLVRHELSHFIVAGVGSWLFEVGGQVFLPVEVDHVVAHVLEHLYFTVRPLVEVHGFDLGDVHAQLSMHAYTQLVTLTNTYLNSGCIGTNRR